MRQLFIFLFHLIPPRTYGPSLARMQIRNNIFDRSTDGYGHFDWQKIQKTNINKRNKIKAYYYTTENVRIFISLLY